MRSRPTTVGPMTGILTAVEPMRGRLTAVEPVIGKLNIVVYLYCTNIWPASCSWTNEEQPNSCDQWTAGWLQFGPTRGSYTGTQRLENCPWSASCLTRLEEWGRGTGTIPPPPPLSEGRQVEIIWTRKLPPSSPLWDRRAILPNHIKLRTCSALAPILIPPVNESAKLTQGALLLILYSEEGSCLRVFQNLSPRLPEKELYVVYMYFRTVDTSTDTEDLHASSVERRLSPRPALDPPCQPLSGDWTPFQLLGSIYCKSALKTIR